MKTSRYFGAFLPLLVFALLGFFLWRGLSLDPRHLPSSKLNQSIPSFALPGLESREMLTDKALRGHFSLLNVWASWCASCAEEQFFLMQLQKAGIPIFGINYKDKPSSASAWLAEWGNPYQHIGQDPEGKLAIDLGVYGTPETFLLDEKGKILYRHAGVLDEAVWLHEFVPRMPKAGA